MTFPIVIEHDEDGYFAQCPTLPGCHSEGKTYEEVWRNIREAVELVIEDRREHGEPIPVSKAVSLATLEVAA
ncbi:MAG TPA: type II toxin-antitoxin system HicB family antitoxin [Fimbriimonas sp.]|nr:type II toxin-antitoxin system HicB family antitoxin [Fimbriimonas sp.]